jgi:hypothetical protein
MPMRRVLVAVAIVMCTLHAYAQDRPPSAEDIVPSGAATSPRAPPPPPTATQPVVVAPPPTATATATAPPPPPTPEEPNVNEFHPSFKLEIGGTLKKLDDFGVTALDLRGAVGAENKWIGHYLAIGFIWGATSENLRTYDLMIGYNLDFRISIVRLGAGFELGYLWVRRASVDSRMFALGIGAYGHGGIDIVQFGPNERFGFYVDARFSGSIHYTNTTLWGPSLMLGVRY